MDVGGGALAALVLLSLKICKCLRNCVPIKINCCKLMVISVVSTHLHMGGREREEEEKMRIIERGEKKKREEEKVEETGRRERETRRERGEKNDRKRKNERDSHSEEERQRVHARKRKPREKESNTEGMVRIR